MKIEQHTMTIKTPGRGTQNITQKISSVVETSPIKMGLCHLFLQHTSASLVLCENYDPQVRDDLEAFFVRLVPDGDPLFKHVIEGEDDLPAHIRTILTQTSITIPIKDGRLALGTWQGVYLYEHRYQSYKRNLLINVCGN